MPEFSALPPELNWTDMFTGDHMVSTLAAASTYQTLASVFGAEGIQMSTTAATTAVGGWEGLGGLAMTGTAMTYSTAVGLLAAWLESAATASFAMAEAYSVAFEAMVPAPVCTTNRVDQASAVATNFFGIRTPEIVALDTDYFGHMWTTNAAMLASYEAATLPLLATLAIPAPLAPLTANPAGPASSAAAVGQAAGNAGAQVAQSASLETINELSAASPAAAQLGTGVAESSQLTSMLPQMMGMMGMFPQMASQPMQMFSQLPQMAGQFPQMATGMLGPLMSGMNQGLTPSTASVATTPVGAPAPVGAAAVSPLGPGGAAPLNSVSSNYTRPSGSFASPGTPRLPAGWGPGDAVVNTAASATPTGNSGTGGLYGAPPGALGARGADQIRDDSSRTLQLVHSTQPGGR